ncbi:hypothetical protein [Xenorhabdus budapestensis]|uniref:Uncharacterized protein n=1 Tax=Xenorhabdus budapestensis TaxID=290110 RepID=A0A2D0J5B2_XENBU|nr:hypothetical protein [Xenorhabdus budapestensis]PHM29699.1 hypothetical protein Xbud_00236 [Xenorhabdus budapestensis]QTL39553.1 hypothetical protein HGO23_17465 [Xenorhabdus budapestensis]
MIGLAMVKTIRPGCQLAVLCWIDILQRYLWRSISCFLPANRRALYSRLYSPQGLWKKFLFHISIDNYVTGVSVANKEVT